MEDAGESLAELVWAHAPAPPARAPEPGQIAAETPESRALARELKLRGFRFVGPTTVYSTMQACGVVNDHLAACPARPAAEAARAKATLPG